VTVESLIADGLTREEAERYLSYPPELRAAAEGMAAAFADVAVALWEDDVLLPSTSQHESPCAARRREE
jgi:hypothetical protein